MRLTMSEADRAGFAALRQELRIPRELYEELSEKVGQAQGLVREGRLLLTRL